MVAPSGSTPAVSVVMPVRNGGAFFPGAVESILGQTLRHLELIVVDDGSTDGTSERLAAFAAMDARVVATRSPGKGIVDALNHGMGLSRAALIARMDADDIARPERLERQAAFLEGRPDLYVLGSSAIEIDAEGTEVRPVAVPVEPAAIRAELARHNPILHPTVVMRRTALDRVGGYRKALTHAEDYDLWLRLAAVGDIANLPEPLLLLRRHSGQVSRRKRLDQRAASALARRLAEDLRADALIGGMTGLHEALPAYLERRGGDRVAVGPEEARDIELILRGAWAAALPIGSAAEGLASRLGPEGGLAGAWKLPFRRWLRI
ncbi:MAG: glycosyltransferase family 2 protein [Rhizobiaceae bacterium]